MPKIKTHRGAAKRVKKTGTGLFKRAQAGKRHILTKKGANRKRQLRKGSLVSKPETKVLKVILPYA